MLNGKTIPPGIILIIAGIVMAILPGQVGFDAPIEYAWGAVSAFALGVFLVCLSVKHIVAAIVGIVALIAFIVSAWNIFGPLF